MNEEYRELDRRSSNSSRDSLVERLDPALGEASSGIGVLLSELVRRTLRGGVAKIEEEMHDFVEEKVSESVAQRMPQFQEAATQAAQEKARLVARQEVESVERQAHESAERLAGEIAQTERRVEDKARTLTHEAVEVVSQETKATAERLAADLAATERRAQELFTQHVEELKQKSKSTYLQVRESLDELAARAAALDAQLAQTRQALETSFDKRLQKLTDQQYRLEARVAELERPRGLRALWRKLFGRKKSPPAAASESPAPEENLQA